MQLASTSARADRLSSNVLGWLATPAIPLPDGTTTTSRAMAYYRLADGKIVVNDVMFVPDLMQLLGPFLAPAT